MTASELAMPVTAFTPPAWLRNPHLQSMLPTSWLWRGPIWHRSRALRASAEPQIVQGDDVRLSGYLSRQRDKRAPWVILLHGWLGDAHSNYMLSLGATLFAHGYQVVRLNLRDHGGSEALNAGLFHSCLLNDVVSVVRNLQQQQDMVDMSLVGFSLGGNFALRVAAQAPAHGIALRKVVAICPALDPRACDIAMATGLPVYQEYFLRRWKQSLLRKQRLFAERYDFSLWLGCRTLNSLTDALVRRYAGFAGVDEYYAGYSLLGETLAQLQVSSHVLLSADDPIVPIEGRQQLPQRDCLRITQMQYGGHCGFISGWRPRRWSDAWTVAAMD